MDVPGIDETANVASVINLARNATALGNFSPIMLMKKVPQALRLLVMIINFSVGSTLNGLFISSFFLNRSYNRLGNIYLMCVGIADFMVTFIVMGMSAVVLLSGRANTVLTCKVLQFTVETSLYIISASYMVLALANFYWVTGKKIDHQKSIRRRLYIVPSIFVGAIILSGFGVFYELDYDYCQREYYGDITFRLCTGMLFHILPGLTTIAASYITIVYINHQVQHLRQYRHSLGCYRMYVHTKMTVLTYIVYAVSWIPHIYFNFGNSTNRQYYYTAWFGLFRSVYASVMYNISDKDLRKSFVYLFNYCFCKNALAVPRTRRRNRGFKNRRARANEIRLRAIAEGTAPLTPPPVSQWQEVHTV